MPVCCNACVRCYSCQDRSLLTELLTKSSAVAVEEKKDEAIEAQKEKAKEQIDDSAVK